MHRAFSHEEKLALKKQLGFDVVPGMDNLTPKQIGQKTHQVRDALQNQSLVAEFVAALCGTDR